MSPDLLLDLENPPHSEKFSFKLQITGSNQITLDSRTIDSDGVEGQVIITSRFSIPKAGQIQLLPPTNISEITAGGAPKTSAENTEAINITFNYLINSEFLTVTKASAEARNTHPNLTPEEQDQLTQLREVFSKFPSTKYRRVK